MSNWLTRLRPRRVRRVSREPDRRPTRVIGAALGLTLAIATVLCSPNGPDSKRWPASPEGPEWPPAELRDVVGVPLLPSLQAHAVSMSALQYLVDVGRAMQEYQGLSYAVDDVQTRPAARARTRSQVQALPLTRITPVARLQSAAAPSEHAALHGS